MEQGPLNGQVALVTGAGRRLGREIALALARAGADIVVNYHASHAGARAVAREIELLGRRSLLLRANVAQPAQVRAMFRSVQRALGRLDLLVNNAAVFFPARWDQMTEQDWDRMLDTNLKGTFFCAQAAARLMQLHGQGRIINISSLGGLQAWPDYPHYCASKAGVIMLTRCLAKALAPRILVNSIAPGTILFPNEEPTPLLRKVIRKTPARRAGRPQDISDLVLYLASADGFITGQTFVVDGGQSA